MKQKESIYYFSTSNKDEIRYFVSKTLDEKQLEDFSKSCDF